MKVQKIILTAFLSVVSLNCFCQGITISGSSVKYSENLSPYVVTKATNHESVSVTTIVFEVIYENKHLDMFNIMRHYSEYVTVSAEIGPSKTKSLTFSIPKAKEDYSPYKILVSKVRLSNGTLKEY